MPRVLVAQSDFEERSPLDSFLDSWIVYCTSLRLAFVVAVRGEDTHGTVACLPAFSAGYCGSCREVGQFCCCCCFVFCA